MISLIYVCLVFEIWFIISPHIYYVYHLRGDAM